MEEKKETFTYTYSAKEQEEIKKIRGKYATPTEKEISMEQLRRLDASATKGATIVSLIIGIISALIMGIGMCCTMVSGWEQYFIPGIFVGVIGIIGVISAYPIYTQMVRRKRAKLAPEIMRLTDELMK
ncbi:MAG: hypothetical protein K2K21_00510 [Lachnospiraceae bacterium]|nr:hypothetical protein [Lachnospiraceae bacterium]